MKNLYRVTFKAYNWCLTMDRGGHATEWVKYFENKNKADAIIAEYNENPWCINGGGKKIAIRDEYERAKFIVDVVSAYEVNGKYYLEEVKVED